MNKVDANEILTSVFECGYMDTEFLIKTMNNNNVSVDEVIDGLECLGDETKTNINSWLFTTLDIAANNFKNEVIEYMNNNYSDTDIDLSFIEDFEPNIYTNYLDTFYNSKLEEYDLTDFSEDNIKNFVQDVLDDKNFFDNLDKQKNTNNDDDFFDNLKTNEEIINSNSHSSKNNHKHK